MTLSDKNSIVYVLNIIILPFSNEIYPTKMSEHSESPLQPMYHLVFMKPFLARCIVVSFSIFEKD